jgi:hypothetical protein
MHIRIYDNRTIDRLPWPATEDGEYARRLLEPLVTYGARRLIDNVDAEVRALTVGDTILPLVLSNTAPSIRNAYVCSPTTHYIDYAIRELAIEFPDWPRARALAGPMLDLLRPLLRWSDFERVVYVNNWLLSTNLYPELSSEALRAIRDTLAQTFPDRAIVFRSVNAQLNARLGTRLERLAFRAVFSRQVYLLDPRDPAYRRKKSFQKDMALARRTTYRWEDRDGIEPADIDRIKQLYDTLYLDKYSYHNPQFNARFIAEALRQGWLTFYVLREPAAGRVDGVLGFVERQGVMTAPLIGYDRSIPSSAGLYRLISLKLVEEAVARGRMLHQSSGASAFKRHRGSQPSLEYNMVYDRHLPPRRRRPWQLLELLSRVAIIPVMRRYKL